MLKIDGIEITMEGPFHLLIQEAAKLVHSMAKAGSEKYKDDQINAEEGYSEIVEMVLEELFKLKKFDSGNTSVLPGDVLQDFDKMLRKERSIVPRSEGFIDYDTSKPDVSSARNLISGIIKDTFNDPKNKKNNK